MVIKPIINDEEYINFYPWIKECNYTEISPSKVLLNCLNGTYFGYTGFIDDKLSGMAICRDCGDMVFIVGMWCKGNMLTFQAEFLKILKERNFKRVRGAIKTGRKFPENIEGLKPLWTVYEKEL